MASNSKIYTLQINGVETSIKNIDELKNAVSELEKEFETAEFGTDQFNQLSKEISKAKGELETLEQAADAVTGEKISDGFLKLGEAAAGAFGVISSGLIALGADSEEMEKVQAKFEGVIAVLNSTKMITEALSAENQRNIKLALASAEAWLMNGKAAQSATAAGQVGVKGLGQSFASFGKALLANPIFLIASVIIGIIAATGKLDDVIKVIGQTFGKIFAPLIPVIEKIGKAFEPLIDAVIKLLPPFLELATINLKLFLPVLKAITPLIEKMGNIFNFVAEKIEGVAKSLTGAISAFTDWIGLTDTANEVQIDLNKTIELAAEFQEKYRASLENAQKARQREIDLMRAQGASASTLEKKELDLLKVKRDSVKAEYDYAVAILQRLKATGQLDKLTREQKEQFLTLQNELLDAQTAFDVKNAEVEQNRIKRNEDANKKISDATQKNQADALKALQEKLAKDNDELEKQFVEKRIELNKQRVKGEFETQEELNEKLQVLGKEQVVAELAAANKALDEIKTAKGLKAEEQLKLEEDINKKILSLKEKLSKEELAIFEDGRKKEKEAELKEIEDRNKEISAAELTAIGQLDRKKLEKEKTYQIEVAKIKIEADKKRIVLLKKDSVEYLALLQQIKDAEAAILEDAEENQEDLRLKRLEDLKQGFQIAADSIGQINDIIQEQFAIQVEKTEQALDEVRGVISSIDEDIASRKEDLQGLQQEFAEARGQRAQDILDDLAREEAAISKLEKTRATEIAKANKLEAEKARLQEKGAKIAAISSIAQAALATAVAFTPGAVDALSAAGLAVRIAAALALVGALFSSISQFKSMKFEDGGVVNGPSHAQGGVRGTGSFGNIEVEGGEFVVNKQSTAENMDLLKSINGSKGRFKFADGGIVGATGAMQSASQLTDIQTAAILQSMQALANRPSVVSVVDITNVSNKVTAIQDSSSL